MRLSAMAFMMMVALAASVPLMAQRGRAAKPAQSTEGDTKPATAAAAPTASEIINLNTATAVQLASLPGIGPKAAELIVQYRFTASKRASARRLDIYEAAAAVRER